MEATVNYSEVDDRKRQAKQWCEWTVGNLREGQVIVFSDESRFCKHPDSGWVRFRNGDWKKTALRALAKFEPGVTVWGAIGPGFKSRLMLCSDGVMTAEYQRIIADSGMIEAGDAAFGCRNWMFQQDGAPSHTAIATMGWLSQRLRLLACWRRSGGLSRMINAQATFPPADLRVRWCRSFPRFAG